MNVLANFRHEPIRSRKLLDSAKGQPCEIRIPGGCNHDPETTVSCHVHDDSFGMAQKADDSSTFHGCAACHSFLDTGAWLGKFTEAQMLRMILRAILRTLRNRIDRGFLPVDRDIALDVAAEKHRHPRALPVIEACLDERPAVPASRVTE